MCYHLSATERRDKYWSERYHITTDYTGQLNNYYHTSGFNHPVFNTVASESPHEISNFDWGLIPYWVKDEAQAEALRKQTINARCESIFEKPSFRESIYTRRCIIPVTGFFEWHTKDAKSKFPFFIYLKAEEVFSIGGIYDRWTNRATGEVKSTFSVITTDANPMMAAIHNTKLRMPLILPREKELEWIKPDLTKDDITLLMKPFDENLMEAYTVSRRITDRKLPSDVPEVLKKFAYPELIDKQDIFYSDKQASLW